MILLQVPVLDITPLRTGDAPTRYAPTTSGVHLRSQFTRTQAA